MSSDWVTKPVTQESMLLTEEILQKAWDRAKIHRRQNPPLLVVPPWLTEAARRDGGDR